MTEFLSFWNFGILLVTINLSHIFLLCLNSRLIHLYFFCIAQSRESTNHVVFYYSFHFLLGIQLFHLMEASPLLIRWCIDFSAAFYGKLCHRFVHLQFVRCCLFCCIVDGTLKLYNVAEDKQLHSCTPSSMVRFCIFCQLTWFHVV